MVGYDFIAYTLIFVALLIISYHFFNRKFKLFLTIILAIGMVYFIFVEIPVISSAHTDSNADAEYLIVLGAGVNGDKPSLSLKNRIDAAYDYLQQYPESIAIVSGGKGIGENISEADCMYNELTAMGISADRVIKEDKATSTRENFEYSFNIIRSLGKDPEETTAFVSSEYHLYRAKLIATGLGVENIKGVAAHTTYPVLMTNYFIREAFAITYYWLTT